MNDTFSPGDLVYFRASVIDVLEAMFRNRGCFRGIYLFLNEGPDTGVVWILHNGQHFRALRDEIVKLR